MSISHHKFYPLTDEMRRRARGHELPEVQRLADYVHQAEAEPPQQARPISNHQTEQLIENARRFQDRLCDDE
jgi:hypothetical protein